MYYNQHVCENRYRSTICIHSQPRTETILVICCSHHTTNFLRNNWKFMYIGKTLRARRSAKWCSHVFICSILLGRVQWIEDTLISFNIIWTWGIVTTRKPLVRVGTQRIVDGFSYYVSKIWMVERRNYRIGLVYG